MLMLAVLFAVTPVARPDEAAPTPRGSDFAREVYEQIERDIPARDEEAIVLPVDPRHLPPRQTPEWLAGYWVTSPGQCYGGDFGVRFEAGGRFSDYWFAGRYELAGDRLDQVVEELTDAAEQGDRVGNRFTRELRSLGPNEILLDGVERLYRCPEGGMPE